MLIIKLTTKQAQAIKDAIDKEIWSMEYSKTTKGKSSLQTVSDKLHKLIKEDDDK